MKTPHEWPQPPSSLKSSSLRRKLTSEALAAVDWHKPRRFESYSDGDDELPSPHTRDPLETACQSSGFDKGHEGKGGCVSAYGDRKGLQIFGYGNCKGFQNSGYGDGKAFDIPVSSAKATSSSNKEGKAMSVSNRRVNHSSVAPQQHPVPLRFNACPFPGPLKQLAGKSHLTPSIISAQKKSCFDTREPFSPEFTCLGQKKSCFDTREPFSPEVTCLGRVKIKERHYHAAEHSYAEEKPCSDRTQENKKQAVEKNRKDGIRKASEMKPYSKASTKKDASEKGSCLARRRRRSEDMEHGTLKFFGSGSSASVSCETPETRRERAAALAKSLTSLLGDLRRLEMENTGYVPAVPPRNSLLLMRGLGSVDKSRDREIPMTLGESDSVSADKNSSLINESACKNSFNKDFSSPDMEMGKSMEYLNLSQQPKLVTAQKVLPLSELESNSLVQSTPLSESKKERGIDLCRDCHEELALWQRRAIAKLAAIETKRPMKMGLKQPTTK